MPTENDHIRRIERGSATAHEVCGSLWSPTYTTGSS